mmetsp:Transcript_14502/g.25999  ORF Transcript_14502/g.25999 Transcript_14502/m.25999 type:complete len:516 (-) Transcript_14502:25-1572(-)
MADFQKTASTAFTKETVDVTDEERFWSRYLPAKRVGASTSSVSFSAPVTDVAFCPGANGDFAVTSSTRVCIYDGVTARLKRTLARFKDVAYGTSFRHDGKLIAAGCRNSHVYIYDGDRGKLMRMLKGHTAAVQSTAWADSGSFVFSCSDDKTVRYWDVSTETCIHSIEAHDDQVRSCANLGTIEGLGDQVWASGSFDHTVKLWDMRAPSMNGSIMTLRHDGPIEAVLGNFANGKPELLMAAGNVVKVFDIASGGKQIEEMRDHQKTVTGLTFDGTKTRILSSSLDGLLKINDAQTYECTASVVVGTGQGILSTAMSTNNSMLVMGCVSGIAVIRKRQAVKDSDAGNDDMKTNRAGTKRYFMRGGNVGPSPGDFKVAVKKKQRLAAYDKELKRFNYKRALDEVLVTRRPPLVVGLLEELNHRRGLEAALANRDDAALEPILSFLCKFLVNPRFASTLLDVCDVVLNLYSGEIGQSALIDELIFKMQNAVNTEVAFQKNLIGVSGTLDLLITSSVAQ